MADRYWINTGTGSASWATAANWSGAAVPVTGDNAWLLQGPSGQAIDTGLNQSAVLLAGLFVGQAYLGTIGTTAAALQVGFTTGRVGLAPADGKAYGGSGRIRLDSGTNPATLSVDATAAGGADAGLEPVRWVGVNAANKVYVYGGTVGVGTTTPGEAATAGEVQVGGDGRVTVGAGVTLATANCAAGTLLLAAAATTLNLSGGTAVTRNLGDDAFAVATANVSGGTWLLNHANGGADACGTLALTGGTVDLSGDARAKSIGTVVRRGAGTLTLDNGNPGSVTIGSFTN